jgi:predicted membrane channel-forming protein YqfA (hemolysin III family)
MDSTLDRKIKGDIKASKILIRLIMVLFSILAVSSFVFTYVYSTEKEKTLSLIIYAFAVIFVLVCFALLSAVKDKEKKLKKTG